jgi:hypothetical protein
VCVCHMTSLRVIATIPNSGEKLEKEARELDWDEDGEEAFMEEDNEDEEEVLMEEDNEADVIASSNNQQEDEVVSSKSK